MKVAIFGLFISVGLFAAENCYVLLSELTMPSPTESLQSDKIYLTKGGTKITFSDGAIKYLGGRYAQVFERFAKALEKGTVSARGEDGIKMINSLPAGSKGQPFEVKLTGPRGHFRLIGCFRAGVFNILKFDADAPTTVDGWNRRYSYLCR